MSGMLDAATRDALRKPFDPAEISKLPGTAKRPPLDYVGHAAVTNRLNNAAPDWTYAIERVEVRGSIQGEKDDRRFVPSPDGLPHVVAVFGSMTIGGVTRQEVGEVDSFSTYGLELKNAISDFIRRAAMRFGVALDLWSKEELAAPEPATGAQDASVGAGPKGVGEGAGGSAPTDRTAAGEGEYGVTLDERGHRASAPAAVTNRATVEAGEPQPRRTGLPSSDPGKTGDGSSDSRGTEPADPTGAGADGNRGASLAQSDPAASTTPAGDPSPPRVEAPAPPGDGQRGATVIPPSPGTTPEKCSHPSWKPAPRAGFELCTVCGRAEKRKASV